MVIAHPCMSVSTAFSALGDELERDHRVIVYDARGTGRSTRAQRTEYEIPTDARDLAALLEELGEPTVLIAFGDALHRSVEASAIQPEALVEAVVSPGVAALGSGHGVYAGSRRRPGVVAGRGGALLQLFEADYRSGLRTVVEGGNPQFTTDQVQERLDAVMAYSPLEATLGRLRGWIAHNSLGPARALGERLWMLVFGGNIWFPVELADAIRQELPRGERRGDRGRRVSRPDLTAGIVRRITHC